MSFNRGFRHGDNRMNSSYQPNNQRPMQRVSNISPWEGGVVPNSRPSNSQGLLALPTQQLQQNGNNMLSVQQLALASTLLSSLGMNVLPNQQQQQQQQQQQRMTQQLQFQQSQQRNDNLTTLMGRMGRSQLDMMQPSFRQQGQNNYKFNNNITGDRFRGMDAMRNRLHQNMTNNRIEPYSKNRPQQSSLQQQQRRTFVNKPRVDRKPTATLSKQGTPAVPEVAGQASKLRKPVKEVESSESEPKEQEVASETAVDESVKETPIILSDGDLANSTSSTRDEEEVNAKRDWKDEKKDDGNEKVVDPVLIVAVKEEPDTSIVIDSKEATVKDTAEEEKKKSVVFQCHICNVSLNDETLLQEHIQLESHKTLMEKTSESYQAQAAALRFNMQEAYGRIDSLKRNNRHDQHREFCKMCKLNFVGSIASHRKLKEHLQLKTFLHPRCLTCSKEFTTRIEWDVHKLTIAHQMLEQASVGKAEAKAANAGSGPEKKAKEVERKGYQPQRVYGYHYISEGFYCRVCEKFFDKRPLSRAHLQSKEHYDLCIAFEAKEKEKKINSKCTVPDTDLASAIEESSMEAEPIVMETEAQAEPESEGSECKRQKLSEDVKDESTTTVSENSQETCSTKAEQGDVTLEEENLMLSTENDGLEGEDETSIAGFLLEEDINMILDESGLDLGVDYKSEKSDAKEEGAKSSLKARRGGRAVRGRKRK